MPASPADDADLSAWRECHDCGLLQRLPSLPDGEAAMCARCDALLRRAALDSVPFAGICAVIAALLFGLALNLPFVQLRVAGRVATSTLFTGPRMLGQRGLPALAVVVFLTLVVMPAVKLAIELTVLLAVRARHPPRWVPWLFGCLERVSPWGMVEVFLLGAFVAYTRLRAIAEVQIGPAILALGGVMLAMVATDATLDREAIWEELETKASKPTSGASPPAPSARPPDPPGLLGCDICRRVVRAEAGDPCPRCSHALFFRKAGSLSRAWALIVAAVLLYIPANVLPVMTVQRLGRGGPMTIINGVVELAANHLWPLALIVLLASVIVPVVKLASLVLLLVLTHRRSSARLRARTRLFRFVHAVGRWSMIDVFMLATLVGVVRLGFLATVLPGAGALAFCSVVLITMAATEVFDPRVMWDAAGEETGAVERGASWP